MTSIQRRVATLAMIFAVVTAGLGMAFAGGATADVTSTGDLSGDDTDTVPGFNASDENRTVTYETTATTDSLDDFEELSVALTYDGTTYAEYSVDDAEIESAGTADDALEVSFTLEDADLSGLPGDAGAVTTVTANITELEDATDATAEHTEFDVDYEFDSTYAAATVNDDSAETEEKEFGFFSMNTLSSLNIFSDDDSDPVNLHTYEETVGIDGSNTTVTVNDATTNGSSAFDDAIGEDKESGDLIYGASASADGLPVLAFYEEANEDMVSENDTYAVYDGSGVWTFNTGDAQDGASEMDVFVSSQSYASADFNADDLTDLFAEQADMSMTSAISTFGFGSFGAFNLLSMASIPFIGSMAAPGGLVLGSLFVFSRRRLAA